MLASLNLLNRFTDLPRKPLGTMGRNDLGIDFDVELISTFLTRQGFEVESVTTKGLGTENVVVGQILDATMHPQADRLRICKVDIGDSAPKQIVCGAPNARAGLFVAVALPGATLPGGLTIVESSIRGIESRGMLCSREELGLSKIPADPDGIWELNLLASCGIPDASLKGRIGQPVFRALELTDIILDLSVTPNRPDCLCHLGIAREIWAGMRFAGHNPNWYGYAWMRQVSSNEVLGDRHSDIHSQAHRFDELLNQLSTTKETQKFIDFSNVNASDSPTKKFTSHNDLGIKAFFIGFQNVTPKASPSWLRRILESLDQNSINDVVDLSNLILLCTGQPSHAFDLDKFGAHSQTGIWLRFAESGESFTGLDGKPRNLHSEDCVVAAWNETKHSSRPEALLGVIGGEHSKVENHTKRIVVEWANPDPVKVRRSSRRIGRKTDSSFQFEKGLDRAGRLSAAALFMDLMADLQPESQYCGTTGDFDDLWIYTSASSTRPPLSLSDSCIRTVTWSDGDLDRFLGQTITGGSLLDWEQQLLVLSWLGFSFRRCDGSHENLEIGQAAKLAQIEIIIPHWRWNDVDGQADIAEEISRMKGIDAVLPVPMVSVLESKSDDAHLAFFERIAVIMSHLGYTEVSSFHFMREDDLQRLGLESVNALGQPVRLVNPIIGDEPLLHTTLIPDLLRKVKRNVNRGTSRGQLFHICRTFQNLDRDGSSVLDSVESLEVNHHSLLNGAYSPTRRLDTSFESGARHRPSETPRLAGVAFGNKEDRTWHEPAGQSWVIHDLMTHLDELSLQLGIPFHLRSLDAAEPFAAALHPKRSVAVEGMNENGELVPLGWLGEFHPQVLRSFEVDAYTIGFEINLAEIFRLSQNHRQILRPEYKPHRLPLLRRDFAVVVAEQTPAKSVVTAVTAAFADFLRIEAEAAKEKSTPVARLLDCRVFDVYVGEKVEPGYKSIAFEVIAEPLEKSFTDETIGTLSRIIIGRLEAELNAVLRT